MQRIPPIHRPFNDRHINPPDEGNKGGRFLILLLIMGVAAQQYKPGIQKSQKQHRR
jgi:hypothetical protein